MDIITLVLYFALSLILMILGLRNVPLFLTFSAAISFIGAAQLFHDGAITTPVEACYVKVGVLTCSTVQASTSAIPAATLLIFFTLFSVTMLYGIVRKPKAK